MQLTDIGGSIAEILAQSRACYTDRKPIFRRIMQINLITVGQQSTGGNEMSFLSKLLSGSEEKPNEARTCQLCQQPLPVVSRDISSHLGLDWWPCPKCHLFRPPTIIASDGELAIEKPPLLVTARRARAGFEILIGIGSLSHPARKTLGKDVSSGRDALFAIQDALDPANQENFVKMLKG